MDTWRNYDWMSLAEKVGITIIILLVTWLLARLVKMAFTRLVGNVEFLQRQGADGKSLGAALGQIASLLVWLLGLIAVILYRVEKNEPERQCPNCGKVVKLYVQVCPRCGTDLYLPDPSQVRHPGVE